jgi:hypothetical protein
MAGICLIRLKRVRPRGFPAWLGISSENAAHRIAVEWDDAGKVRRGVYVVRRDTNSRLNTLAGGRLFPGVHHHARFAVEERDEHYSVRMLSDDDKTHLAVRGRRAGELPPSSNFRSLEEASEFFRGGSLGYSPATEWGRFDGLVLRCREWKVTPLDVEAVRSSFFEDEAQFPYGSVAFDCALLMRNVEHEWHGQPSLCCALVESHRAGESTPSRSGPRF